MVVFSWYLQISLSSSCLVFPCTHLNSQVHHLELHLTGLITIALALFLEKKKKKDCGQILRPDSKVAWIILTVGIHMYIYICIYIFIYVSYLVICHLGVFYSDKKVAVHFATVISKSFYKPYEVYAAITFHTTHSSCFMSSAMLHNSWR